MTSLALSPPAVTHFSEQDWNIYSQFWHPVAFSSEISADKPFGVVLLDVPLVLYRTSQGVVAAQRACPHRGADLAQGWIENDVINCPYHGFQYDGQGRCIKLPFAGGDELKIPEKLCLQTFMVEEKYNLIWVCLNPEPLVPLPDWPELEGSKEFQVLEIPVANWNTSAARHTENFNDQAHVSVLHRNSIGDFFNPVKCTKENWAVFETEYGAKMIVSDTGKEKSDQIYTEQEFICPHASDLKLITPDGGVTKYFDAVCPVSVDKCRVFFQAVRNYMLDRPLEEWLEFENMVVEEDRKAMEAMYPLTIPFARDAQIHTLADQFCMKYRRKLQAFGMQSMGESNQHWYDVEGWRYYPGGFEF